MPKKLKNSDYVDMLLFLSGLKRAVRLAYNSYEIYEEMEYWCQKFKYANQISNSGLMYISKHIGLVKLVNDFDDSVYPHAYILGRLLGYPSCCSKQIANLGEDSIDKWENELINSDGFKSEYSLINPVGYLSGNSLISHVPCSCKCKKPLKIAKSSLKIIKAYSDYECISRWRKWFDKF